MIVEKTRHEGCTVLALEGTIRLGESADFFSRMLSRTLVEDSGHVLIDFSRINHIDSTGIGELVGHLQKFRDKNRKLVLVNPSERIRQLLEMANLDSLFSAYDTLEEALAAEA
jgi:anti-sigma B factor antagonist